MKSCPNYSVWYSCQSELGTRDVATLATLSRACAGKVTEACRKDASVRDVVKKSCACNTALLAQDLDAKRAWIPASQGTQSNITQ